MSRALVRMVLCVCLGITGFGIVHAKGVLFEDDFGSGTVGKWDVNKETASGWSIEKSTAGNCAVGKGLTFMSVGDKAWSNYSVKVRVKIVEGIFEVGFRCGPQGRYYVHYDANKKALQLVKNKPWEKHALLQSATADIQPGKWVTVEISALKGEIKVSLNGTRVIEHKDQDPLFTGGIQLISLDKSVIDFGNIIVAGLSS